VGDETEQTLTKRLVATDAHAVEFPQNLSRLLTEFIWTGWIVRIDENRSERGSATRRQGLARPPDVDRCDVTVMDGATTARVLRHLSDREIDLDEPARVCRRRRAHPKPSPFFRASTPRTQRFS